MMSRERNRRTAITLIEVLIVLSIMCVSLLFTLPAVDRWFKWSDRIRFETLIGDSIQQAKMQAVVHGNVCRVRPDRLSNSLKVEAMRDNAVETLKVVRIPKQTIIQLKRKETGESIPSIEIDPYGLFLHTVRIDVNTGGQRYSWVTDRQAGMITSVGE